LHLLVSRDRLCGHVRREGIHRDCKIHAICAITICAISCALPMMPKRAVVDDLHIL
jgi:hypothetical protein